MSDFKVGHLSIIRQSVAFANVKVTDQVTPFNSKQNTAGVVFGIVSSES